MAVFHKFYLVILEYLDQYISTNYFFSECKFYKLGETKTKYE